MPEPSSNQPSNLSSWANAVKRRDGNTCQWCGEDDSRLLHAHHVIPRRVNPALALSLENGITLCANCHAIADRGGKRRKRVVQTAIPAPVEVPVVPGMWRVCDVARMLAMKESWVRRQVKEGVFLWQEIAGHVYVLPESLAPMMEVWKMPDAEQGAALAAIVEDNRMHEMTVVAAIMDGVLA